jgi:signal transduction histidine kinase
MGSSETETHPLRHEFGRLKFPVQLQFIHSLKDLQSKLQQERWDLVLSDYRMPSFTAVEALDVVKKESSDLPFILFCECIGEETLADMMKAGVEDVVLKSRIERLIPVVRRIMRENVVRSKEARAQKLASEALASKEQMLAIVSHDIKNPLSAIQLEAQMLLRAVKRNEKSAFSEEVKIQAGRILKTTDRMKILISDLLDKNKSENNLSQINKRKTDISRLVHEVLESLRPLIKEKDITVDVSIPSGTFGSLDRNKMFQVFANLMNNAIKFTPFKGTIRLSLEDTEHEFVFTIEDSGPGLEDQELTKVFDKYWSGNSVECPGTGLGLFICKTIVEAHSGHIFVEKGKGTGACFKFTLPKLHEDMNKVHFSYVERRGDQRKKIYVVDDDEDLREVISWVLGKEGHSIHSFHSPEEALECLLKGRHRPDLIVVDFHMDEMKGSEFVKRKHELLNTCPVVMISATPDDVEREVPREMYGKIITKPIDLEGLVNSIQQFFDQ